MKIKIVKAFFTKMFIFTRNPTNNNLVLVNEDSPILQEFKRLFRRVIVETNENRNVNEEEAKRIRLSYV